MALADDDQILVKKLPTPQERADYYDLKIKPLLEGVDAAEFREIFVNSADSYKKVMDATRTVLKNILDMAGKKGMAGMLIRNKVASALMDIRDSVEGGKRRHRKRKTQRKKAKRSTRSKRS